MWEGGGVVCLHGSWLEIYVDADYTLGCDSQVACMCVYVSGAGGARGWVYILCGNGEQRVTVCLWEVAGDVASIFADGKKDVACRQTRLWVARFVSAMLECEMKRLLVHERDGLPFVLQALVCEEYMCYNEMWCLRIGTESFNSSECTGTHVWKGRARFRRELFPRRFLPSHLTECM